LFRKLVSIILIFTLSGCAEAVIQERQRATNEYSAKLTDAELSCNQEFQNKLEALLCQQKAADDIFKDSDYPDQDLVKLLYVRKIEVLEQREEKKISKKQMEKEGGESIGDWRVIRCIKSKVGVGHWVHEQPIYHGVGRDPSKELFQFLKAHKAVEQRGAYYVINGDSQWEKTWVERIRDVPEWRKYFLDWALSILRELY